MQSQLRGGLHVPGSSANDANMAQTIDLGLICSDSAIKIIRLKYGVVGVVVVVDDDYFMQMMEETLNDPS